MAHSRTVRIARISAVLLLTSTLAGCVELVGTSRPASPPQTSGRAPAANTRPIDPKQAQRLQRVMTPLIKAMDRPLPLNQVKIGFIDDPQINAASGGNGEFFVTRGLVLLDQMFPGAASGGIAPIAAQLVMNKYTQSEEYAADRHGMQIPQKAGMPPGIMADTLTWLKQTDGGSTGGFFSTHPATGDRIEALRKPR